MSNFNISEKVRKARRDNDLSQANLAVKIGISLSTIQRIENGESDIEVGLLNKISKVTGKPMYYFIGGVEENITRISTEVLEALEDPIAIKALLITYKNSKEIKQAIQKCLEYLPRLSIEKRNALLTLCEE